MSRQSGATSPVTSAGRTLAVCIVSALTCVGLVSIAGLILYLDLIAPARVLHLGELVTFQPDRAPASFISGGKGVSIGAMEYAVSGSCPVGKGEKGEVSGTTKFIAVRLYAENPNLEAVTVFPQDLSLRHNGETVAVPWEHLTEEGKHCDGDWLAVSFL